MNKQRRKAIDEVRSQLSALAETIQGLLEDEQDAFDSLPESIRDGTRGDTMQDAIDALESAADLCDELDDALSDAQDC